MALHKKKYLKISKGQISKALIERTDIGLLDDSGQEITNFYNSKYGSLKTSTGTVLKYSFGNKKIKLCKIILNDGNEGMVAFNGTDGTISLFDYKGDIISNITSFTACNENNVSNISVVQNQEYIIVCTKDAPLYRLYIDNLPILTISVFEIPASKIIKASNITAPVINPILFRLGTDPLPTYPEDIGISVGDYAYLNGDNADPDTTFPWTVKRLDSIANPYEYEITSVTIHSYTTAPTVGDILVTPDGSRFRVLGAYVGGAVEDVTQNHYFDDPTGTAIPTETTGTGVDVTIDVVGATIQTVWSDDTFTPSEGDAIKDTWNDKIWQYKNGNWAIPDTLGSDYEYTGTWQVSATIGVMTLTLNNGFTLTAPTGLDPLTYAKNTLIGVNFDGLSEGIGVCKITGIKTYNIVGQDIKITQFLTTTLITFLAANTNYNNGRLMLSQVKIFDGDYPNTENNPTNTQNYPLNVLFYQQRLIIAGTTYNPQQLIFSVVGKYDDFSNENLSTSAFQLIIGSTEKEEIKAVLLNQGIQIFCRDNEWLMTDQVISASSGFLRNSSLGTNGVQPVISANGTSLFVPKNGKGIIGFTYDFNTASYSTPYITLFTDLLDNPIKDLFLKKGLDSQDDTLLFICDEEGNLIIGNYQAEHEIQAFCKRSSPNSKFLQTMQCESNVFFVVNRNGLTGLELLDDTKYTVCSTNQFIYSALSGQLILNTDLYNGQRINVYDGNREFVGSYLVNNRRATITSLPQSISEVGFNIKSVFQSNPMNIGMETKALYKNIPNLMLAITGRGDYLKVNGKFGRNKDNFLTYTRVARPNRNCIFTIENEVYPCEILSIEVELEA